MKFKSLNAVLAGLVLSASCLVNVANAGIITIGDLSSDSDGHTIVDNVSGREYLRFDEFHLSYADTLASVLSGGIYEDYKIADSTIMDDFTNKLFGVNNNSCSTNGSVQTFCGTLIGWQDGVFGSSYNANHDLFGYLNTSGSSNVVSYMQIDYNAQGSNVIDIPNWTTVALDQHNLASGHPINLVLYKDSSNSTSVPEPSTLAIFALGIMGLASRRFKKKS